MAERKRFAIRTEPHVAEIGDDIELLFQPEVMGDEFMDAYARLQSAQAKLPADPEQLAQVDPEVIKQAKAAVREFLADLMVPESREHFAELLLPDRVLTELLHWVVELYGDRPTGSSSGSAPASPPGGTSGTGNSRSKGSTRTRGRSAAS